MERCFLTSPFFLQCYKPQYNSFKIVFDLQLIKAIDLYTRHRIKISSIKTRTRAHLELKETNNTHIKGTFPLAFLAQFCTMNNLEELQPVPLMELLTYLLTPRFNVCCSPCPRVAPHHCHVYFDSWNELPYAMHFYYEPTMNPNL